MRRWIWLAVGSACSLLAGAIAACSTFSAGADPGADAGVTDGASVEGSIPEAGAGDGPADAGPHPVTVCPLVPTVAPCTAGCADKLRLLPSSSATPGVVKGARIASKDGKLYVARVVDGVSVELFSYDSSTPGSTWTLLGSYAASAVYGLALNDTEILLSLRSIPSDAGPVIQLLVEIDQTCRQACTGKTTLLVSSPQANHGVVAIGHTFYFSVDGAVMSLKDGALGNVGGALGGPVVAADCANIYWSNVFDPLVHRYDDATGVTVDVGTDVGTDAGFDGGYAGTISLAATETSVFASTGSGHVYVMPKTPPAHKAQAIVNEPGVGPIVADDRFVYYGKPMGLFLYNIVRVHPDGGAPLALTTTPMQVVDMTTDADHVYVIENDGSVTRIAK